MNTFVQNFTSPEWTLLVKALLHTLWQGGLAALLLGAALKFCANPGLRYRCSLGALATVLLAGLVTWATLDRPLEKPVTEPGIAPISSSAKEIHQTGETPSVVVIATIPKSPPPASSRWTAWLALAWLGGAGLMLLRAGAQVAGAERLRRSCQPLNDPSINALVQEARRAIRVTRPIRVAVTDKLTSPAVVGVLMPSLILPLSLVTTLSHEQIRFILLHELAHIRRGDYLANLFQLFAEALLFFNPAVWWISHQIRREREACCDALAIQLSGAPADYARTLVHVAESILTPPPAAAPAFGEKHEPSSLTDRVQRLLVPGYRPALRLTWRAMLTALLLGSALLAISAVGTRVTVAAAAKFLTPKERIERIEKKMTEYGQRPGALPLNSDWSQIGQVEVTGKVRTEDGSALPKWTTLYLHSDLAGSPYSSAISAKDGIIKASIRQGTLVIGGELPGYAPTVIGPFETLGSNHLDNLELVFQRGFPVQIQGVDAVSGKPIANARFRCRFWLPSNLRSTTSRNEEVEADATGIATLEHCARLPLNVTLLAPGYELAEKRFEALKPGQTLTLSARRGLVTSGTVLDKVTGSPISGATILLFYQEGPTTLGNGWDIDDAKLATTDSQGAFTLHQLRSDSLYWLGVTAPGRESLLLGEVHAGQTNLVARLGPTLVVHGRILGDLESLRQSDGKMTVGVEILQSQIQNGRTTWNTSINVKVHDDAGYFEFTNRIAGLVKVIAGGRSFHRDVEAPVDDWVIDLNAATEAARVAAKREVIFRFKDSTGIPLKGVVSVSIPDSLEEGHLTAHSKDLEIKNGEVRAEMPIGGRTSIEPKQTVGYWFQDYYSSIVVSNGVGPMIVEVPVIPAGAIYAQARNSDGTPAHDIYFSALELKKSPRRDSHGSLSGGVNSQTTKWVSGPLPLDGTYEIVGQRENSFCVSEPIKLTEAKPDAEVQLRFAPGKILEGVVLDPDGKPVRSIGLEPSFSLVNHGFGLKSVFTDEKGHFQLENLTPDVGEYFVQVNAPGFRAERVRLNFASQPQTIRLQRGRTLAGRVVEAGTGFAIPGVRVTVADLDSLKLPMLNTQTDAEGHFEFSTLGDVNYTIYVGDGQLVDNRKFKPDGNTNVTLRVRLYKWSELKPKAPATP